MSESDERELREGLRDHFEERADASAAPPFERAWGAARVRAAERANQRGLGWSVGFPVAGAVAAGALLAVLALVVDVYWASPPAKPEREFGAVLASAAALTQHWEAPLDFLLATPGLELIQTVPSFGVSDPPEPDETNAEGAQSARPRERMTT